VRTKKISGLVTLSGLLRLVSHAAMGIAMGLAFALLLMLIDPSGIATRSGRGGPGAITAFASTLALTFGIGATLTGAVFIVMEDS
jgi:polyferredoxin